MQKPLLTFFVAAFNQEAFVRHAVDAALAQTYSPLEVILSDDCSSDRTFEIMQTIAAEYHGPHQVIMNRNPIRQSLGGHLNKIVAIARGELIVAAAGDDISLPDRTLAIYEAWEKSGRKATSIHSDYVQIDENGLETDKLFHRQKLPNAGEQLHLSPTEFVKTLQPTVFGCTHAFSKKMFQVFGDVPPALIHEDDVLALRSILAGRITYIREALVKYRLHGQNVYARRTVRSPNLSDLAREEEQVRKDFFNRRTMFDVFIHDLNTAKDRELVTHCEFEQAREEAAHFARRCSLIIEFLDSGFLTKCSKLMNLAYEQLDAAELRMLRRRLLPLPLLLRVRLARNYAAQTLDLFAVGTRAEA